MRFEVTQALDAIERRLGTDPLITGAVVDLGEAVRLPGLDNRRPANLLRLGPLIDALSRTLADASVAIYGIAERGLLADADLTSNERMVLRRWSDDGLVEILPAGTATMDRACEVGLLLNQPVLTAAQLRGFPGSWLTPLPAEGAMALVPAGSPPAALRSFQEPAASAQEAAASTRDQEVAGRALRRLWRCAEPGCASFGPDRTGRQPPPQLGTTGVPVCPRHLERLADAGPRPCAVPAALRVDGVVQYRFPVLAGAPVTIGRAPDGPGAVAIAEYLDDQASRRVSRHHLRLELRDEVMVATDLSTNGSVVVRRDRHLPPRRETLATGEPTALGEWDAVELYDRVEVGRADRAVSAPAGAQPGSVMVDAPTVALRLPRAR